MSDALSPEEKRIHAQRAREVIDGAGWVIDAYVKKLTAGWINTKTDAPLEIREDIHRRIRVALELKADLAAIITEYDNDEVLRERRNRDV